MGTTRWAAAVLYLLLSTCTCDALVVVLPCGVSSRYTASNATSGMQLVIRNCSSSAIVDGTQIFVATYLYLDFNSSVLPPPANLSLLVEDSASVNIQIFGGNGSSGSLGDVSLLSGFNLTLRNVTNAYSPQPQATCAQTPNGFWCLDMVDLLFISLDRATLSVASVTLNRSTIASVIYMYGAAQVSNTSVDARDVVLVGSDAMMRITGSQVGSPAAVEFQVTMSNVTVLSTGIVPTATVSAMFLRIARIALINTIVVIRDVLLDDVGLVGSITGVALSALHASSNVSLTFTNVSASMYSADYTSLYITDSILTSSRITLRSHTIVGNQATAAEAARFFSSALSLDSATRVPSSLSDSTIVMLVAIGQRLQFQSVDAYVVFIDRCALSSHSALRIILPPNVTSTVLGQAIPFSVQDVR
jgi:hypothetical protein